VTEVKGDGSDGSDGSDEVKMDTDKLFNYGK
jgi:hypothetical protein